MPPRLQVQVSSLPRLTPRSLVAAVGSGKTVAAFLIQREPRPHAQMGLVVSSASSAPSIELPSAGAHALALVHSVQR
jgi:hypothetical protein